MVSVQNHMAAKRIENFPAGDPRYPSKEHECLEIIRKYDDSKLEVSQPRAEQSVWQTASGKLDFQDEPLVPKKIGYAWDTHPDQKLVQFRKNLPIFPKRAEILDAVQSSKGKIYLKIYFLI